MNLLPFSVGYTAAALWLAAQHTVYALAVQTPVGLLTGNWWAGGLAMCAFWAGREHAQAEARYIAGFVPTGHRADMPWWAGYSPKAWNVDSFIFDLALPCLAAWVLAGAARLLGG